VALGIAAMKRDLENRQDFAMIPFSFIALEGENHVTGKKIGR
jgi:hypothetical protein